jgi:exportin-1
MGVTSQALLDFSREFDVSLMDNVVTTLYSGSGGKEVSDLSFHLVSMLCLIACTVCFCLQQQSAQQVLTQFQDHPEAWTRVPDIMERSSFPQTKVCTIYVLTGTKDAPLTFN